MSCSAAVHAPSLRAGAAPPDGGHIPASFVGGVCPTFVLKCRPAAYCCVSQASDCSASGHRLWSRLRRASEQLQDKRAPLLVCARARRGPTRLPGAASGPRAEAHQLAARRGRVAARREARLAAPRRSRTRGDEATARLPKEGTSCNGAGQLGSRAWWAGSRRAIRQAVGRVYAHEAE